MSHILGKKTPDYYREYYSLTSEGEVHEVQAKLQIAAWMGVIDTPDLDAVEVRRKQKNDSIKAKLAKGEIVYGLTHYTPSMYLQYELTRFKLDFTVYKGEKVGTYLYQEFTEEEKRAFYENNPDLFTRYFGDSFGYEEVCMIIEKRLKEKEYESIVQDLLCKYEV